MARILSGQLDWLIDYRFLQVSGTHQVGQGRKESDEHSKKEHWNIEIVVIWMYGESIGHESMGEGGIDQHPSLKPL